MYFVVYIIPYQAGRHNADSDGGKTGMERNEAVLNEEDKEAIVRQFMSFCLTAIRFECYDFYREQRR